MHRGLLSRFAWPPSLSAVWLTLPFAALLIRLGLMPIYPYDYWWPIVQGRHIITQGVIPTTNNYLYTLPSEAAFHNQPWLAQVLMYLVESSFGHTAQILLHISLLLPGVALAMHVALKRGAHARTVALLTAAAAILASLNLSVRTQMYAYLPFLGVLLTATMIAREELRPRWILLAGLLSALWANVHGSFILATVLIGMTGIGDALQRRRTLGTWDLKRFAWWVGAGFFVLGCTMCNPSGPWIYVYVFTLVGKMGASANVSEWQAMGVDTVGGVMFYASVVAVGLVALWQRQRVRVEEVLLIATVTMLAINSQRSILWWALACMLILPVWLSQKSEDVEDTPKGLGVLHIALSLSLLGAGALCLPGAPVFRLYTSGMDLTNTDVAHHPAPEFRALNTEHPMRLVARLKEERPQGRIFHEQAVGGLLEYMLVETPTQISFVDQRFEMIPPKIWDQYFMAMKAGPSWRKVFAHHNITSALIARTKGPLLIQALDKEPGWTRVDEDPNFVMFFQTK